ncbi:signal peptidase II [Candidatus Peregrinibacteria bacterium]|jgi:signal peptidase II|nr:signal peptidase II [Candidatus Peregrinibacteria bacterium]
MQFIFFLAISFFIIGLDLFTKALMTNMLQNGDIILWKSIIFTLEYNKGIAFSIPLKGTIQIALSLGLLTGLIIYAHKHWHWKNWITTIGTSFICGGALGNLYERVGEKGVTDFIQVFSWFPVFNLADTFIFLGVFLLFIFELQEKRLLTHTGKL